MSAIAATADAKNSADDREDELPFSLVCLDMDGTLLNDDHEITQRTASMLNTLSASGVTICIATGRSFGSVVEYVMKSLQLAQETVPIICFNGSCCMMLDTTTGALKPLFCDSIEKVHLQALLDLCEDRSSGKDEDVVVLQYYDGATGKVHVASTCAQTAVEKDLMSQYVGITGHPQNIVPSYASLMEAGTLPVKCLALTPDVDALMQRAAERLPSGSFHMIRGSPFAFFVEFLRPGCTKGTAVEKLVAHLSLAISNAGASSAQAVQPAAAAELSKARYSLERTIAFGDGENDVEMLTAVGHGVAMQNARQAAKQAANAVNALSNNQDGVADYLERVFFV